MRFPGVLLLLFCLIGCKQEVDHKGKIPLVEISGNILYKEDLMAVLPTDLSKEDSLLFAENYIKNWIEDILLYDQAKLNVPDDEKIDQLIENYRKTLIMHTYQQAMISQKLSGKLTDEELLEYYNNNENLFIVDQPLIKGLFIKVPVTAKDINDIRNRYKRNTPENIEILEKYSLNNAVSYDYFYDKWILASDILDKIPLKIEDINIFLDENRQVEVSDDKYYYFLNIEELLEKGKKKPFEFVEKEIRSLLINMKQISFIQDVKNELYDKAINSEKVIYYY